MWCYKATVEENLAFADLLRLMDERSTAFQAAVAAAPSLDVTQSLRTQGDHGILDQLHA